MKLLIISRNTRFQKITNVLKKHLPKNIKITEINDNFFNSNKKYENKSSSHCAKHEKKLKLYSSTAASNYILYYDYLRLLGLEPLILRNSKEIENEFLTKIKKIQKILFQKYDVIFYETLDNIESIIIHHSFKKTRALLLEARFSGLGPLAIYPAAGIHRKNPLLEKMLQNKEKPSFKSICLAKLVFQRAKKYKMLSEYEKWHSNSTKRTIKSVFPRMFAPFSEPWARQKGYLRYRLNSLKSLLFDSRLLIQQVPRVRFIVYFLNHLPEASTFSEAPEYHDIPSIALRLARFRPAGIKILIKEHPRSLHKRPPGFYQRLSKIPGVSLLHPSVSNDQLFASAEAVLVVTGTPGLQAGAYLTPVGVLGRPAWSRAPWVREIINPEQIFSLRRSEVVKKKNQCIWFMAKYLESTFPINWAKNEEFFEEAQGRAIAEMLVATYRFLRGRHPSKTSR